MSYKQENLPDPLPKENAIPNNDNQNISDINQVKSENKEDDNSPFNSIDKQTEAINLNTHLIPKEDELANLDNKLESIKKKCCFVELNENVSNFNLSTYYLVQFSYVCACTFIDACQDYLIESPEYYNVSKDSVGQINGDILVADNLFLIAFIYIYGSFHDIFGRKIMVVFGFLSMSLSLALYPLAGNIYPNLILVRLIFSNGICAVTTQPLLADYVSHKTKGFGGGIAAVVSGFGAIFAVSVLLKLQSYMSLLYVYWSAAAVFAIVAVVCAFGVKNIQRREDAEENVCKRFKTLFKKLREGFNEVCNNAPLRIGIATSALARMNTMLISLFIVMWVKQNDITDAEAINLGHMISGIGNSIGLISALLFGFMLERKKTSSFLLITNALVVIGYSAFYMCNDPHHWLVLVSISTAAFGFYGLITLGYVMVNQHCGHKARGSVMGINCLFGAIGLLVFNKIGGVAFDKIDKSVPFLAAAFFSFILFFVVLFRKKILDEASPVGCPIDHSKIISVQEENKNLQIKE